MSNLEGIRKKIIAYLYSKFGKKTFSIKYKEIAKATGENYSNTLNAMTSLMRNGFIERLEGGPGKIPVLKLTEKVLRECSKDVVNHAKVDTKDAKDNQEVDTKEVQDSLILKFEDKDTRVIYDDEYGYVVPIPDIAKAIGIHRSTLSSLIRRNKEIFEGHFVRIKTPISGKSPYALTRKGIIAYLQKTETSRMKPEVKENIIRFQRWATEKLDELITGGKAEASPEEQNEFMSLIQEYTGINDEGLRKLVYQIQDNVNKTIAEDIARTVNYVRGVVEERIQSLPDQSIKEKHHTLKMLDEEIERLRKMKDSLQGEIYYLKAKK